jgi:hypothetical protein
VNDTDTPRDPDWDDVPLALEALAGLNDGRVTVIEPDGVSSDVLVIVPGLFAHARRIKEARGWVAEDDDDSDCDDDD